MCAFPGLAGLAGAAAIARFALYRAANVFQQTRCIRSASDTVRHLSDMFARGSSQPVNLMLWEFLQVSKGSPRDR